MSKQNPIIYFKIKNSCFLHNARRILCYKTVVLSAQTHQHVLGYRPIAFEGGNGERCFLKKERRVPFVDVSLVFNEYLTTFAGKVGF